MDDDRVRLTYEDAVAMLPDGDDIHTFVQGGMALIGADWRRDQIIGEIRRCGAELSGEQATMMKHGLVITEGRVSPLFIATR